MYLPIYPSMNSNLHAAKTAWFQLKVCLQVNATLLQCACLYVSLTAAWGRKDMIGCVIDHRQVITSSDP